MLGDKLLFVLPPRADVQLLPYVGNTTPAGTHEWPNCQWGWRCYCNHTWARFKNRYDCKHNSLWNKNKKKKSQKKMERKTKQVRTDTTPPSGCVCAKQAKHRYRKSVFIWLHDARKKHVEALSDLSPPAAVLIRQHDGKKTHLRRTWRSCGMQEPIIIIIIIIQQQHTQLHLQNQRNQPSLHLTGFG